MLNLGLYFLHVAGAYKIYIEFFFGNFSEITIITFGPVHLPLSFIGLLIVWRHFSSPWIIPGLYHYWWCVNSFKSPLGNKETWMFYIANVITFREFSELLWKSTLLVRYKLNRFQPRQVNQFDIYACLFGGYSRFIPLDKIFLYG